MEDINFAEINSAAHLDYGSQFSHHFLSYKNKKVKYLAQKCGYNIIGFKDNTTIVTMNSFDCDDGTAEYGNINIIYTKDERSYKVIRLNIIDRICFKDVRNIKMYVCHNYNDDIYDIFHPVDKYFKKKRDLINRYNHFETITIQDMLDVGIDIPGNPSDKISNELYDELNSKYKLNSLINDPVYNNMMDRLINVLANKSISSIEQSDEFLNIDFTDNAGGYTEVCIGGGAYFQLYQLDDAIIFKHVIRYEFDSGACHYEIFIPINKHFLTVYTDYMAEYI